MAENQKRRFSLSTNILIGMFLGIACGIFFGEEVAFLQVAGNAFIKLLQMTILPYILVSLVNGIGGLTYDHNGIFDRYHENQQAKNSAVRPGVFGPDRSRHPGKPGVFQCGC